MSVTLHSRPTAPRTPAFRHIRQVFYRRVWSAAENRRVCHVRDLPAAPSDGSRKRRDAFVDPSQWILHASRRHGDDLAENVGVKTEQ